VDAGGCTALHYAAWDGHVECVKVCLELHANVDTQDRSGWTPLHIASANGYLDVSLLLLNAGATVDATSDLGWTPLYYVTHNNHVNTARLLIDRGGKLSNVKLDKHQPLIPDWVNTFIASRLRCRSVAILVVGIHKYHRTNVTGNNDINVLRLIGKHVWSTRMGDVWSQSQIVKSNLTLCCCF
jgi:ankyrin repeat protein